MTSHYDILIVGGGAAGISAAARLSSGDAPLHVAILEPADWHYYQPLWTLVGGGVFTREHTRKPMSEVIPPGVTWLKEPAATFAPDAHSVTTAEGRTYSYDQLIVAPGLQLDWHKIKGLDGHMGQGGICSNYAYDTVNSTWEALQNFRAGNALFTFPRGTVKCGGAPQKIMWISEHYLQKQGLRDRADVHFVSSGGAIFGVEKYKKALQKLVAERDIHTHFGRNLIEVRPDEKLAVFESLHGEAPLELPYEMLHITPPQSAPDFIKTSPLADAGGWVEVDRHTLQHTRFPDVFSAGDASSLPTAKTGAAIRKQVPVLVANLLARRQGRPLTAAYHGYTSCPLVTGYGRLILAEFDYDGNPVESFPFDQAQERYSMYALKAYMLPEMYWHGMLKGRA
ncbi:pyridine nucleotide-disulfide oxidoreductase [Lujinxingia litoralis]|uniref:Pyridine nucleotide-disulfide oxidoreductase n=1 Tax=Lujinxingia litoralis TaxID=2211119 RepID=A0A328CA37_9DELT|nr:FAD/NAD(P)-binding oxidoreductase [Lujinxingia litoralis]RAL19973.1 pyridine nucleotide-disulfide oxidoreductase [Lujinxingia litoralis]RAL19980.1 pyridine nucleotide-disulfide oxidoreductase [Lujinxingia litoralis]RAL20145.1 pyridine nucleotide-disulfide oxidoreductase [Lujinxingia litoralis]RAL22483.1 pyridine nucleotide-disulfide oxidoreductase [Lujinxingia litoralis]